jgi:hypothetical protein
VRNAHKIFVGQPEGESLLRRPRHSSEADFKMDRRKWVGGCGFD